MRATSQSLRQELEVLRQQNRRLAADNLSEIAARETWRRTANELQDRLTQVRSQAFTVAADIAAAEHKEFLNAPKHVVPPTIVTYNQARAYAALVIETKIRALQ